MTLGKRIKELRNSKKITQEELAQKLDTTRPTLSNWELDRTQPGYTMLTKIAEYFDVTTDYLLNGTSAGLIPNGKLLIYLDQDKVVDISELGEESRLLVLNVINLAKQKHLNKK